MVRRLSTDWSAAYGHSLLLAETFVDPSRFGGHMYMVVGWARLGRTKGYARANGRYCDGGMLEVLMAFGRFFFEEDGNHDSQQATQPPDNHISFF